MINVFFLIEKNYLKVIENVEKSIKFNNYSKEYLSYLLAASNNNSSALFSENYFFIKNHNLQKMLKISEKSDNFRKMCFLLKHFVYENYKLFLMKNINLILIIYLYMLEGIVIFINDEHSLKAKYPISVTNEGIEICVNDEHIEEIYLESVMAILY